MRPQRPAVAYRASVERSVRILVTSLKGGVGKTTTAVHLATYLAQGAATLLIDADPAGGALSWAGDGAGLPFKVVEPDDARPKRFAHVVVDTRASPRGKDLREFSGDADLVVLPTAPSVLALAALTRFLPELEGLASKVLVTLAPPFPSRDGDEMLRKLTQMDTPHFRTVVRRYAAYERAVVAGVPVRQAAHPSAARAWADYEAVGRELLGS